MPLPEIKKTLSNRNKEMLLVDKKYQFNLSNTYKDGSKLYKCKEYKTNLKCPASIKMKGDEVLEINNKHNHAPNEDKVIKDEMRKDIKKEITHSKDPFSIKLPKLYKSMSADKGIRAPSYDDIKSGLYKNMSKILPEEVNSFDDIPDDSIYYKTIDEENFMFFKNDKIIIFQSPNLAKIHIKYGSTVFGDATFYSCPSIAYQLFITRVYDSEKNVYYTTSFSLMKSKTKDIYELLFRKIHQNISQHLDINEEYSIQELHTDFEIQIGEACRMVYPNVEIKYCIWHMKRALVNKMNSLCKSDIDEDDNLYILFKMINNLYLCKPEFVKIVFYKIKEHSTNENLDKFLQYFEDTYIKMYPIKRWNYYNNYRHVTNNACESYNAKLNNLFQKKPTFFKLLYELRLEESSIINEFKKRQAGLQGSGNRRTIMLIKFMANIEKRIEDIEAMPNNNEADKKNIEQAWYDYVKSLGGGFM